VLQQLLHVAVGREGGREGGNEVGDDEGGGRVLQELLHVAVGREGGKEGGREGRVNTAVIDCYSNAKNNCRRPRLPFLPSLPPDRPVTQKAGVRDKHMSHCGVYPRSNGRPALPQKVGEDLLEFLLGRREEGKEGGREGKKWESEW